MVTVRMLLGHPEADLAAQKAVDIGQLSVSKKMHFLSKTSMKLPTLE